jgi:excisionase family DNA binding protein
VEGDAVGEVDTGRGGIVEQRYFQIQQTATFLGVSKWTVYRLIKERAIPYIPVRGKIVFDREDLVSWMDKRKVPVSLTP